MHTIGNNILLIMRNWAASQPYILQNSAQFALNERVWVCQTSTKRSFSSHLVNGRVQNNSWPSAISNKIGNFKNLQKNSTFHTLDP